MILIGNYFEEGRLHLYKGLEAIHTTELGTKRDSVTV